MICTVKKIMVELIMNSLHPNWVEEGENRIVYSIASSLHLFFFYCGGGKIRSGIHRLRMCRFFLNIRVFIWTCFIISWCSFILKLAIFYYQWLYSLQIMVLAATYQLEKSIDSPFCNETLTLSGLGKCLNSFLLLLWRE